MKGRTSVLEALLIFVCLIMVCTVVMWAFARSLDTSVHTQREQEAIVLAQNAAEKFAANPMDAPVNAAEGDYDVICEVEAAGRANGTLYNAQITVRYHNEDLFTMGTCQYVSGVYPSAEQSSAEQPSAGETEVADEQS